jgi:hypothetical protein
MYQQQLANQRYEAVQQTQQLQDEYQTETPAQSFANQFGDCWSCR